MQRPLTLLLNRVYLLQADFRALRWLLLFSVVFFYFAITSHHGHKPSSLMLYLNSPKAINATLEIDTPRGRLEQALFLGQIKPFDNNNSRRIHVINTTPNNSEPSPPATSIFKFSINGHHYPLESLAGYNNLVMHDDHLVIAAGESIRFNGPMRVGQLDIAGRFAQNTLEIWLDDTLYTTVETGSHQGGEHIRIPIGEELPYPHRLNIPLPISEINNIRLRPHLPVDDTHLLSRATIVIDGKTYEKAISYDNKSNRFTIDAKNLPNQRDNHQVVWLAITLLALLLTVLVIELYRWITIQHLFSKDYRPFWTFFAISLGVTLLVSFSAWPAIIQTDSMATWEQVKYLEFTTWHSLSYSLFILMLTLIYESVATLTVVHILLTSILLGSFFHILWRKLSYKSISVIFFIFTLCSLPILIYPTFFVRDVIYSLLSILLFIYLWNIAINNRGKSSISSRQCIYIGLTIAILIGFRSEGIYLIVAISIIMFMLHTRSFKKLTLVFLIAFSGVALQGKPLNIFMQAHHDNDYELTLLIEPLGYIISQNYLSDDYQRDRELINKVINFDDLANHHKQLEAFWSNRFLKREKYTEEDVNALQKLTIKLCIKNIHLCLKNRARILYDSLLSITGDVNVLPSYYFVSMNRWGWEKFENDKYRLAIYDSAPRSKWVQQYQHWFYEKTRQSLSRSKNFLSSPRTYIWNALFGLIIILAFTFHWHLIPITATISCLVLMRTGLLFTFAPMAHFKYFFDLYLWGYLMIPMFLVEWSRRRNDVIKLTAMHLQKSYPEPI